MSSAEDPPQLFDGWNHELGTEFVETSGDRVILRCRVQPHLLGPNGTVHGGVYCSLIETAASVGAALWLGDQGNAVGVANHTNTLRLAEGGTVTVTATPVQRDEDQQLWRADVSIDAQLVATGEVRIANVQSADILGR